MDQNIPQDAVEDLQPDTIEAGMVYSVNTGVKPVNETMEEGNLKRVYTGVFNEQQMTLRNGRKAEKPFTLDEHGFEFIDHATKVENFFDEDQIKSVYYPEIEQLIKDRTGANRVVVFDHTLRAEDDETREKHMIREPVKRVHNDYTEWSGPQRVRDLLPADEAEELLKHRFAVVQVWRAIRLPIESDPLAICEAKSMSPDDMIASERRYPNRVGETYQISHNPDHRWVYFPKMKKDEALVFKVYDSMKDGRARFTAHTSFTDPTTPAGAPPRESIEMRTIAFFPPE
ncbi:MAG: CmcJ/NvfI family oxidoreductase [Proteobacteria bacterium]|nr:CmcJ/NvfI family oxidoreductase [Pseudomonadota bacterium]